VAHQLEPQLAQQLGLAHQMLSRGALARLPGPPGRPTLVRCQIPPQLVAVTRACPPGPLLAMPPGPAREQELQRERRQVQPPGLELLEQVSQQQRVPKRRQGQPQLLA
jgi:hypothetical protein